MLNSNARRAMVAAAGGSHIDVIGPTTFSTDTSLWFEAFEPITGSTTVNRLTASSSQSIGWYVNIAAYDGTTTTQLWSYENLSTMNSSNAQINAGEVIYAYVEYSGVDPLPQTLTLTICNATFSNEVVWQITATFNPEPA